MGEGQCMKRAHVVVDDDWDELLRCQKTEGHSADIYSREAGGFVSTPTAHRFEFTIDPEDEVRL